MPQILTGLQIALPTALITAVAAEMLMGGAGLGGAMLQAGRYADSPGVYAGVIETAVVGMVTVLGMAAAAPPAAALASGVQSPLSRVSLSRAIVARAEAIHRHRMRQAGLIRRAEAGGR